MTRRNTGYTSRKPVDILRALNDVNARVDNIPYGSGTIDSEYFHRYQNYDSDQRREIRRDFDSLELRADSEVVLIHSAETVAESIQNVSVTVDTNNFVLGSFTFTDANGSRTATSTVATPIGIIHAFTDAGFGTPTLNGDRATILIRNAQGAWTASVAPGGWTLVTDASGGNDAFYQEEKLSGVNIRTAVEAATDIKLDRGRFDYQFGSATDRKTYIQYMYNHEMWNDSEGDMRIGSLTGTNTIWWDRSLNAIPMDAVQRLSASATSTEIFMSNSIPLTIGQTASRHLRIQAGTALDPAVNVDVMVGSNTTNLTLNAFGYKFEVSGTTEVEITNGGDVELHGNGAGIILTSADGSARKKIRLNNAGNGIEVVNP